MTRVTLALCTLVLSIGTAAAADVAECATIKDEAVRLFCYDRAAGRSPAGEITPAPPDTQPAPASEASSPEPASKPVVPVATKPPARIESRIDGRFSGWVQGTRFQLENGQTWEVIAVGRVAVARQESPSVVIKRDLIGQYQLAVDGVKERAIVRQVEEVGATP